MMDQHNDSEGIVFSIFVASCICLLVKINSSRYRPEIFRSLCYDQTLATADRILTAIIMLEKGHKLYY